MKAALILAPWLVAGTLLPAQGVWYRPENDDAIVCPRIQLDSDPRLAGNRKKLGAGAIVSLTTQTGRRVWPVEARPDLTAFTVYDEKDKPVTVASLKGKVVLVALWSMTCPPSIAMLEEVSKVYANRNKFGFEILCVNFDSNMRGEYREGNNPGGWPGILKFKNRNRDFFGQSQLAVYLPGKGSEGLGQTIGDLESIPALLVLDKNGRLVSFEVGYRKETIHRRLGYAINEGLGKVPPEAPSDTLGMGTGAEVGGVRK